MLCQPEEIADEKIQFKVDKQTGDVPVKESNLLAEEVSVCLPDKEDDGESKGDTLKSKAESKIDAIGDRIGTRTLVIIAAILIILLILMLIIFASWPRLPHHLIAPKCNKPHCLRAAAMFVDAMNESANPCADTWEWACGKWLKQNNTITRGNWDAKDEIRLRELTKIRDVISTTSDIGGPDSPIWKVKTLYESCMNLDGIEGDHDYPLKKLIFEIGQSAWWSILSAYPNREASK